MTTRFKNAIDALVYAFFNDTLAKGTCNACAVGNMVAHGFGKKVDREYNLVCKDGVGNNEWHHAFMTNAHTGYQTIHFENFDKNGVVVCCNATGYTALELAMVEKAFEKNTGIHWTNYESHQKDDIMQDQYNGLMAVVDVLCEIEGIEDPTEYKELFAYA